VLYVCATPIGNLGDLTPRVLDALRTVDLVAAEDTRRTRKLLSACGVHAALTSFFAHNEVEKTAAVLELLREGKDVALVTDAGTPGVSDPGARLVAAAAGEGLPLTVLPGPSAVTTALVVAGLAGDEGFRFAGFLPRRGTDLRAAVASWRRHGGVVVAFESGRRLARSLGVLSEVVPAAPAAVCRELTKVHEEVARATVEKLALRFATGAKGEVTLVLDLGPARPDDEVGEERVRAAAASLLDRGLSRRDAAAALTVCLGMRQNEAKRVVAVCDRPAVRSPRRP
jgi:16S rRNA (cytidine1402-2'-O)-methyltransferase